MAEGGGGRWRDDHGDHRPKVEDVPRSAVTVRLAAAPAPSRSSQDASVMRRRTLSAVLVLPMALVPSMQCIAGGYPDKPLHLIIPLRPGDAGDIPTHEMAPKLSAVLGHQLLLEKV